MPAVKYPGRGPERTQNDLKSMRMKLVQLEDEPGAARNHALRIEESVHELAERLGAAFSSVFPRERS